MPPGGTAAATEQAPAYVAEALTHARAETLTDFVAAVIPAALPDHAGRLLIAAAAPPIPGWLTPFPPEHAPPPRRAMITAIVHVTDPVAYAVSMTLIMRLAWAPRGFVRRVRRI